MLRYSIIMRVKAFCSRNFGILRFHAFFPTTGAEHELRSASLERPAENLNRGIPIVCDL